MISEEADWNLAPCGIFYMGNKIGNFDELDYWAVLESSNLDIVKSNIDPRLVRIKIPGSILHQTQLHPKVYLYESLKYYLEEATNEGNSCIRDHYLHPRGPGMCLQLGLDCHTHGTHQLAIDLSPVILWKDTNLGQVWKPPSYMRKPPFNTIIPRIEALPVYLIPSTNTHVTEDGVSEWKVSFNNTKQHIFTCLDSVSPNIRRVFHLTKYTKEFLPRKLRYTEESDDFNGSWKDGSLISSYVLYNILLQNVAVCATPLDWTDELLPTRLEDILTSVSSWSYNAFFKNKGEKSYSLDKFNEVQKSSFEIMMTEQMNRIIATLKELHENYRSRCTKTLTTENDMDLMKKVFLSSFCTKYLYLY